MLRLTREGPEGRMARNGLVAAMWRDIDIKNKTLLVHIVSLQIVVEIKKKTSLCETHATNI